MTTKQLNSKANKLFNKWRKDFSNNLEIPTNEYYAKLETFKDECKQLHDVVGCYEYLTNLNALKMASICSTLQFVKPYQMLQKLQHQTKTY